MLRSATPEVLHPSQTRRQFIASILNINAPNGESFALFGSSLPGGPIDTIASPLGLDVLKLLTSLSDLTPDDLLMPFHASGSTPFNIFHFTPGGGFSEVGSAMITLQTASTVSEPPTVLLIAVAALLSLHLRRKRRLFLKA